VDIAVEAHCGIDFVVPLILVVDPKGAATGQGSHLLQANPAVSCLDLKAYDFSSFVRVGLAANPKPTVAQILQARVLIGVLSIVLVLVGVLLLQLNAGWGFQFVGWGGGILLTYLVVDVLLLHQDRVNWSQVGDRVRSDIRSELRGVRIDVTLLSGAQDIVVSLPANASREEESRLFAEAQMVEARRLAGDLGAMREKLSPAIEQAGALFKSRADHLASFQSRYWSRLLEPALMGYLIELEGKLRFVDTSLSIYLKYKTAPAPTDNTMEPLREYLIGSSKEALVESVQQLLTLVLEGVNKGFVPAD
jgi:hypothetical protein